LIKVYVAGPYSADNILDVLKNIRTGISAATLLLQNGFAVFCPFVDFQYGLSGSLPMEVYKNNSLEFLNSCDIILMLPGWEQSKGAKEELRIAMFRNMRVFYDVETLLQWSEV
jgi:hypothetical protein